MPSWLTFDRVRRLLGYMAVALSIVLTAVYASMLIMAQHPETVEVAGQRVEISATPALDLSGPAQMEFYGLSLTPRPTFYGLMRPKLVWEQEKGLTPMSGLVQTAKTPGIQQSLKGSLLGGWERYSLKLFSMTVLISLGLALIVLRLWREIGLRRNLLLSGALSTVAVLTMAVSDLSTAMQVAAIPSSVHSLDELFGQDRQIFTAQLSPQRAAADIVVLGDSTASGSGLPPLSHETKLDAECDRSADSFAEDLARSGSWKVQNLACSGASIANGVTGRLVKIVPHTSEVIVPSQLKDLEALSNVQAVIVEVGANDLDWRNFASICLFADQCYDNGTTAMYKQQLKEFDIAYVGLLKTLHQLPSHPVVLVNLYYNPMDARAPCKGITNWTSKVQFLTSRMAVLNDHLQKAALGLGFVPVQPNFSGHEICTRTPYVQGPTDEAPFHPTALGQAAIALADQLALSNGLGSNPPAPIGQEASGANPANTN